MSDLTSVLPANATELEKALELVARHGANIPSVIGQLWNPDTCPPEYLVWLAWALSVDFWDAKWSDETKRNVLRDSVQLHKVKGTLGSVKRALKSAGYGDARVVERYAHNLYDGQHLHDGSIDYQSADHWAEYRVFLTRPITIEQAAQVREILSTVAPARCHLKALDYRTAANLYDGSIFYDGTYTQGIS